MKLRNVTLFTQGTSHDKELRTSQRTTDATPPTLRTHDMTRKQMTDLAYSAWQDHRPFETTMPRREPEVEDCKISKKRVREWEGYKRAINDLNKANARLALASRDVCKAAKTLANTYPNGAVDPIDLTPLPDAKLSRWIEEELREDSS